MTYRGNNLPLVHGHARNAYPGDRVYVMDHAHTDDAGEVWPTETEYMLESAGADGPRNVEVQHITIKGRRVTFSGKALAVFHGPTKRTGW